MDETRLQPGVILRGNNASYCLKRRLGRGKYGEVWQASVQHGELWLEVEGRQTERLEQVALKIMHPRLTEEEQNRFRSEIDVLRELQAYEQKHDLRVDGHSLVPTVFDYQNQVEPHFFVQTLAPGRPLDELMRERGAFPEQEALAIMAQFYHVLEVLHEGVKRSYLDFQPKNIFWDEQTGRIMVIDWNLLSKLTEARFEDDLLAAAKLLYRLLMGVSAPKAGSRRALAQPHERWECLSLAVQDVLTTAFHPNVRERHKKASELRQELEEYRGLWQQSPGALVTAVETQLPRDAGARALSDREKDHVRQAVMLLSIAEKQESPLPAVAMRIVDLRHQLAAWMTGQGHLENGQRLFDAGDHQAALQDFQAAVDEAWNVQTALTAFRWVQIVQAAQNMPARYERLNRDKAKQGLALLEEKQSEEAIRRLSPLAEEPGAEALKHLVDEARAWIALQEAEEFEAQQEYGRAVEKIREALRLEAELPYVGLLGEAHGDLGARAQTMEERAKQIESVENQVSSIKAAFGRSFVEGYNLLAAHLDQEPGHPSLVRLARNDAEASLEADEYDQARAMAALALDYTFQPETRQPLVEMWQIATALADAKVAWEAQDWGSLSHAVRRMPQSEKGTEYRDFFLKRCFNETCARKDLPAARVVLDLMDQKTKGSLAEQYRELEASYQQDLSEAQRRIDNARKLAEEAQKLDTYHPQWALKVDAALAELLDARKLAEIWVQKSRTIGWTAKRTELESLIRDLEVRKSALQEARARFRTSYVQVVERLWPLVFGVSLPMGVSASSETVEMANQEAPVLPPTAEGRMATTASADLPLRQRMALLQEISHACNNLLRTLPDDPEAPLWCKWQKRAQTGLLATQMMTAVTVEEPRWKQVLKEFGLSARVRRWIPVGAGVLALAVVICIVIQAKVPHRVISWLGIGPRPTPTATRTPIPMSPTVIMAPLPTSAQVQATIIPTTPIPIVVSTPTSTPTSTSTNTPTPTETPPPVLDRLAFPPPGETYPVMPWQVVVTNTAQATVTLLLEPTELLTDPVTVTLSTARDGQAVLTSTRPLTLTTSSRMILKGSEYVFTWKREVADLEELPDGEYNLRAMLMVNGQEVREKVTQLLLQSDYPRRLEVKTNSSALIQKEPEVGQTSRGAYPGKQVLVLGRVVDSNSKSWYLCEALEKYSYLVGDKTITIPVGTRGWITQEHMEDASGLQEDVPLLAPTSSVD